MPFYFTIAIHDEKGRTLADEANDIYDIMEVAVSLKRKMLDMPEEEKQNLEEEIK